jgi:hypothetical protein
VIEIECEGTTPPGSFSTCGGTYEVWVFAALR